jgi:hypothetical protein
MNSNVDYTFPSLPKYVKCTKRCSGLRVLNLSLAKWRDNLNPFDPHSSNRRTGWQTWHTCYRSHGGITKKQHMTPLSRRPCGAVLKSEKARNRETSHTAFMFTLQISRWKSASKMISEFVFALQLVKTMLTRTIYTSTGILCRSDFIDT